MFGGSPSVAQPAGEADARPWQRDSRHRFVHLALECVRRELISKRKFDELRRLVGVSDSQAEALLRTLVPGDDDRHSPKEPAREPRG